MEVEEAIREISRLNNDLVNTQRELYLKNAELERINQELNLAYIKINQLKSLLPICMYCKKIKDNDETWMPIEKYLNTHTQSKFSHGICDDCLRQRFPANANQILEED